MEVDSMLNMEFDAVEVPLKKHKHKYGIEKEAASNSDSDSASTSSSSTSVSISTTSTDMESIMDYFKLLPDEIIGKIFQQLAISDLLRCDLVCKRFHYYTWDKLLWGEVSLTNTVLKAGAVGNILKRPIKYLKLNHITLTDPIFDNIFITNEPDFQTSIKKLHLREVHCSRGGMVMLLSRCKALEELTIERVKLDKYMYAEIRKFQNLKYLKIVNCNGTKAWNMLEGLNQLTTLTVSSQNFSANTMSTLVLSMPPNLEHLIIEDCHHKVLDIHLGFLMMRCPYLTQVTLGNCGLTSERPLQMTYKPKSLNDISFVRCRLIREPINIKLYRVEATNTN